MINGVADAVVFKVNDPANLGAFRFTCRLGLGYHSAAVTRPRTGRLWQSAVALDGSGDSPGNEDRSD
jgi:hypothetical protein